MTNYINRYLDEVKNIAEEIDKEKIEKIIKRILIVKKKQSRIFFLGVGGSAANCSHAVNDFRKIAEIDSYTPMDNVAEITARTNDEGWETVFKAWLERSKINKDDLVFILSVGGGDRKNKVSVNLINAIDYAQKIGCDVVGIVGRDGGYTAQNSHTCIVIPTQSHDTITPHAEAWQAVIWHLIVTDPRIQSYSNKWESIHKK
jgi:D-sedoheptulose 7-phosphate isomerase|tara:strand:+ start:197 stop:802 length:606 start_codon:yes stop_codon:yes gene_type:complete